MLARKNRLIVPSHAGPLCGRTAAKSLQKSTAVAMRQLDLPCCADTTWRGTEANLICTINLIGVELAVELKKAIYDFVAATLPALILYFVGWTYLYFFLGAFGINIAEIHFDTATIFIYAFSPLQIAVKTYGFFILSIAVGGLAIIALIIWLTGWIFPRLKLALEYYYRISRVKVSGASAWLKIFLLFVIIVIFLLVLVPVVKWAAMLQKTQVWAGHAEYIVPLRLDDSKSQAATESKTQGTDQKSQPAPNPTLFWRESYAQCVAQQALLLIYADDKAYYLLCKSVENSSEGIVFEVRREFGLTSVRFASFGDRQ
jgi:hypothetical protein